jgi:hypothetical protein
MLVREPHGLPDSAVEVVGGVRPLDAVAVRIQAVLGVVASDDHTAEEPGHSSQCRSRPTCLVGDATTHLFFG